MSVVVRSLSLSLMTLFLSAFSHSRLTLLVVRPTKVVSPSSHLSRLRRFSRQGRQHAVLLS
ncbi:hypothetical protein I7I53_02112 [Histoplasma capsulatum var. duboisii H88]|uniref:Uncharacterized protein n=1 Tax=Ajellomyces capsulatus (strain H88) TaxID=544711 RepID=A0A8A1LKK8_AJEC8|nr:hypothetical protein I7I53_02112 [Histoplasma capsulatum var. duboisii H88]